jgi:general secretion pathway protein C
VSLDSIAKRYFPAIVCSLLFVVALFQARGIAALVAGQLPDVNAKPPAAHGQLPLSGPAAKSLSAKPILARNAFDSVTGPLDAPPPPPPAPVPTGPADANAEDPPCPSGSIVLIAEDANPEWSFAMIRTSAGSKMRRIGDDVDGQKVKQIAWDRVWLTSGAGRCQLKLDIAKSSGKAGAPPTPGKPGAPPSPSAKPDSSGDVTKISDNEYVVSRAAVERQQGFGNELRKGTSLVPGHGVRLQMVPPTSLLGQVGINTGDIVKSINGFDLTDLDKATEGYNRLKTSKEITLAIERNNNPMTITVRIQ